MPQPGIASIKVYLTDVGPNDGILSSSSPFGRESRPGSARLWTRRGLYFVRIRRWMRPIQNRQPTSHMDKASCLDIDQPSGLHTNLQIARMDRALRNWAGHFSLPRLCGSITAESTTVVPWRDMRPSAPTRPKSTSCDHDTPKKRSSQREMPADLIFCFRARVRFLEELETCSLGRAWNKTRPCQNG